MQHINRFINTSHLLLLLLLYVAVECRSWECTSIETTCFTTTTNVTTNCSIKLAASTKHASFTGGHCCLSWNRCVEDPRRTTIEQSERNSTGFDRRQQSYCVETSASPEDQEQRSAGGRQLVRSGT